MTMIIPSIPPIRVSKQLLMITRENSVLRRSAANAKAATNTQLRIKVGKVTKNSWETETIGEK